GKAQPAQLGAIHLQDRSVGCDAVIPARSVLVEIAETRYVVPFSHSADCGTGDPLVFPIVIPPQGLSRFPDRSLPASAVQSTVERERTIHATDDRLPQGESRSARRDARARGIPPPLRARRTAARTGAHARF